MKIKLLILCLIAQVTSVVSTTKRNLQSTQKQLLKQQDSLLEKTNSYPIFEICPTKPPKKYHGGHEKVRLQKAIELLKAQNEVLKSFCPKK